MLRDKEPSYGYINRISSSQPANGRPHFHRLRRERHGTGSQEPLGIRRSAMNPNCEYSSHISRTENFRKSDFHFLQQDFVALNTSTSGWMSHPLPFHVQDGFSVAESDVLAFARQVATLRSQACWQTRRFLSNFPHCRLVDLEVIFANESFLFLFLGKMLTIWWCWF